MTTTPPEPTDAHIIVGDATTELAQLDPNIARTCITSPPYWSLRNYDHDDQLGNEPTATEYIANMVAVFQQVKRLLTDDGTLWLNIGDTYYGGGRGGNPNKQSANWTPTYGTRDTGGRNKDLAGIPWRLAFALQDDGWYLRQDIIWHKPNPMPEPVTDRCVKSHEYLFLLTKSPRYHFDHEAIQEPAVGERWGGNKPMDTNNTKDTDGTFNGLSRERQMQYDTRNKRSVWTIPTKPYAGAHMAVMPEALVEPCILAATQPEDTVLDPFTGSGTVAIVALHNRRHFIGTELNPDYAQLAQHRIETNRPHPTLF